MSGMDRKVPCPKCGKPLRHRAISNLRYCVNPQCPTYKGIPPIKVNWKPNLDLVHATSDEVWAKVEKEISDENNE